MARTETVRTTRAEMIRTAAHNGSDTEQDPSARFSRRFLENSLEINRSENEDYANDFAIANFFSGMGGTALSPADLGLARIEMECRSTSSDRSCSSESACNARV